MRLATRIVTAITPPLLAAILLLGAWGLPARAQSYPRLTSLGFCSLGSVATAVGITTTNCVFGSFTGVQAGTTLTVSALTCTAGSGNCLLPGQKMVGAGLSTTNPETIVQQLTGTAGSTGTYQMSQSLTVGSEAMTSAGIPPVVGYAVICASTQAVNYRDDGGTPVAAVGSGGQFIPSGQCIPFNAGFARLLFIQQSATAVVGVSFYR